MAIQSLEKFLTGAKTSRLLFLRIVHPAIVPVKVRFNLMNYADAVKKAKLIKFVTQKWIYALLARRCKLYTFCG